MGLYTGLAALAVFAGTCYYMASGIVHKNSDGTITAKLGKNWMRTTFCTINNSTLTMEAGEVYVDGHPTDIHSLTDSVVIANSPSGRPYMYAINGVDVHLG